MSNKKIKKENNAIRHELIFKCASEIDQEYLSNCVRKLIKPMDDFFKNEKDLAKMYVIADAIQVIIEEDYKPKIINSFKKNKNIDEVLH